MMENHTSRPPSSDRNRNSEPQFLPPQPFPWSQGEGDDWSLAEFLGIVKRRSQVIISVAAAVMVAVIGLTLKQKPEYVGNFRLLVEPLNNDSKLQNLTLTNPANSGQSGLDYASQIQVLMSPNMMASVVKQLQASYPDLNYDALINALTITRLGETKFIEVRYRSDDPKQVKAVLDKIAASFLAYSRGERQTRLQRGINFVEKELKPMQQRVDRLERDLQNFRQKYDLINPDTQAQQVTNQLQNLSIQRLTVNQQLAAARANLVSLQGTEGAKAALNNASVYQGLIVQLRQLDTQLAGESALYQEANPRMQILRERRQKLLPLLREEAQRVLGVQLATAVTTVQTLEVQSQELAKAEQRLQQQAEQLPLLARQYTELQRNLQVATESLNRFLTTRETLKIEAAQTEQPWVLVQPPLQPQSSVSGDMRRNLGLGLVASLLSGVGIALMIDKLDDTFHTVNALKQQSKLPIIGTIPFERQVHITDSLGQRLTGLKPMPTPDYHYCSPKFVEALRVVQTNMQLLGGRGSVRSVVVSSAMAGDGKSTIAFYLAQIAAAMGQRVLLVDADLRQPTIHQLGNLSKVPGLSNLITSNLLVRETIQHLPSMSELSAIASGVIPPDPTQLLSSPKMKRLMAEFHKTFDLVIYDAPPLVGLADARLLAPHTDGILLVVRMGKTNRLALQEALDSLRISRIHTLGIVSNAHNG